MRAAATTARIFSRFYCGADPRAGAADGRATFGRSTGAGTRARSSRVNVDGSIPADNPVLNGVRSHVFSYGHRNPQGLAFGPDGRLYESEHGQDTDDEVNRIEAGRNYGWPLIAGYKDDQYYTYANWSASAPTPCSSLDYGRNIPSTVPQTKESGREPRGFHAAVETFFTVPSTHDTRALGNATAALAGLDVYTSSAIPAGARRFSSPA